MKGGFNIFLLSMRSKNRRHCFQLSFRSLQKDV